MPQIRRPTLDALAEDCRRPEPRTEDEGEERGRSLGSYVGASLWRPFDEPAAEVLRSPDQLTLGEPVTYDVRIHGVFKTNGACRIEILDQRKIVSGKIADATLEAPHNVYTKALDEGAILRVVAQPTMKDGKLHRLFITGARLAPKRRAAKT
jgi:hypothetical protein